MADVLACIDHSAYANGVCDHAGWFASDPDVGVEVLHVDAPSDAGPNTQALDGSREVSTRQLLDRSVARLREEGVGPLSSAALAGRFVEIATQRGAAVIVMGKHGEGSAAQRHSLGSNVEAMVRATSTPICLTSKLFLPIHRALVLLDADTAHRTAVEFVISQARLSALRTDIVVVAAPGEDPDPKVTWARSALGEPRGNVLSLVAEGLDDAVAQYMEAGAADLVIVSRAVVTPAPGSRLNRIEERGLWGNRTPVLIC
jgi:nucleotide-binding universal stress UspA family protein